MSENKARRKTPKEFFASFSEETENALYLVDYFKAIIIISCIIFHLTRFCVIPKTTDNLSSG